MKTFFGIVAIVVLSLGLSLLVAKGVRNAERDGAKRDAERFVKELSLYTPLTAWAVNEACVSIWPGPGGRIFEGGVRALPVSELPDELREDKEGFPRRVVLEIRLADNFRRGDGKSEGDWIDFQFAEKK